jgi:hypothetical protein
MRQSGLQAMGPATPFAFVDLIATPIGRPSCPGAMALSVPRGMRIETGPLSAPPR